MPSDPLKRRSHEQSVVPWLPEDTVKLCPSCAKSFNIARRHRQLVQFPILSIFYSGVVSARRKHHCRLCGCVMCADCSDHVAFDLARKLVSPYGVTPDSDDNANAFPNPPAKDNSKVNLDLSGNLEGLNSRGAIR